MLCPALLRHFGTMVTVGTSTEQGASPSCALPAGRDRHETTTPAGIDPSGVKAQPCENALGKTRRKWGEGAGAGGCWWRCLPRGTHGLVSGFWQEGEQAADPERVVVPPRPRDHPPALTRHRGGQAALLQALGCFRTGVSPCGVA